MDVIDIYEGFQFKSGSSRYSYSEGLPCTIVKITDDSIYWIIGDGMGQYYNDWFNFEYDDSIDTNAFPGWYAHCKCKEYYPRPNWEI